LDENSWTSWACFKSQILLIIESCNRIYTEDPDFGQSEALHLQKISNQSRSEGIRDSLAWFPSDSISVFQRISISSQRKPSKGRGGHKEEDNEWNDSSITKCKVFLWVSYWICVVSCKDSSSCPMTCNFLTALLVSFLECLKRWSRRKKREKNRMFL
jgi:hypothetical protein